MMLPNNNIKISRIRSFLKISFSENSLVCGVQLLYIITA